MTNIYGNNCCGTKVDVENLEDNYTPTIKFKINNHEIVFDPHLNCGQFVSNSNVNFTDDQIKDIENEISNLEKESIKKKEKITNLENKIKNIDDTISSMKEMLEIDISERDFISEKIKNN